VKTDKMKRIFNKNVLVRLMLFVGSVAVILMMLPHPDQHSYLFERNQPWRYSLLTAPFDIPVLPDSTSIRQLKDSVDNSFVPFVVRDDAVAEANMQAFSRDMAQQGETSVDVPAVVSLMKLVYQMGILDGDVYEHIHKNKMTDLRTTHNGEGSNSISTIGAESMISSRRAYIIIDSLYSASHAGQNLASLPIDNYLDPNVISDSSADNKYKKLEYLNITGARGVIKQGQRIVDRGEIVTPQIYTNLNTYEEMMKQQNMNKSSDMPLVAGQAVYLMMVLGGLFVFLRIYRPRFYSDMRKMTFLVVFLTLFVLFATVMTEQFNYGIYLVPFAAVPVMIIVFFDARTAIFSLLTEVLICSLVATFQYQFIFVELMVGMAATYSISQLSRRSQLLRTALIVFMVYCLAYMCITLINDGNINSMQWRLMGVFAINSVILSFAYVLIFVIEKIFGFTSTVTLVELSDINNPLLRRLAEEAPGTFQHSMQVSMLAAEGARAIGANTQLARTGALYHDIGKLQSPVFFTENQHGINPHDGLDSETSARKIISHVQAGMQIASKSKLPDVIKRFISEHHGCGVAKYFYNTAVNNAKPGETVDIARYQYPGPDPQSKETSILMMADSVEAASRSLKDYSQQSISGLVDHIVDEQLAEGRFRSSPISLREIETVKETFKKRLATIYHSRIQYPEISGSELPA